MSLRILLVESKAEDALFLRDVLVEIEAGRYWNNWVHIEMLHANSWEEAATENVDLILLGVESFHRAHAASEHVPIILLVASEDDAMAIRMIREGAQDFLVKKDIDCAPLAHAIRSAIERHRLLSALRAISSTDSLTGLANRAAFVTAADRDRKLAERLDRRLMIVMAEARTIPDATALGEQRRDLALVETADQLRSIATPTDLVARIGDSRFAMSIFETEIETLEQAWTRIRNCIQPHRLAIGAAIFDPDSPVPLDVLFERAAADLAPKSFVAER
jgi:diguanylate cyclase (GGDEF)-like protein